MNPDSPHGTVDRYLAATQRARQSGDPEAWRLVGELLDPKATWRLAGGWSQDVWPVELEGRQPVLETLGEIFMSWDRLRTETVNVLACGDTVVVEQVSTLIAENGSEMVRPVAHFFTVTDGLVSGIRTYRNDANAREDGDEH